jgi:signal transduction histidine kinase
MLGRQQIAGIPTAISELFKNAHDAYASRVEVDYFRSRDLLVLRDDGLGMTREEFEDRWLTLGTDSKVGGPRGLKLPAELSGERRPILGEKGIGRLAIASIGSQVVVLTRARRGRTLSDLTVALVNWRLFELPGINLDQLEIPIAKISGGALPTEEDLSNLAGKVRGQLGKLDLTTDETALVVADLDRLAFDPGELLRYLGDPGLDGKGHGTHFLIVPTTEQLAADIDSKPADKQAPPLVQTLIGFANSMTPDSPKERIATAFRDRPTDEICRDLIDRDEFFTPDEFRAADHHIEGRFDGYGRFEGVVSVFGGKPEPYDFVWSKFPGQELDCGPFPFRLGYVQGKASESRLDLALHGRIVQKLDRLGGLYIYREGIRVLPYGTPGYDFLGIERRRTENIGRYFFSYRRMLGVLELDAEQNGALQEKAGREGFRENRAYRQFRDLLADFFVDLAAQFFSERGPRADAWLEGREQAKHRLEISAAHRKRTKQERQRFARRVGSLLTALEDAQPERQAEEVLDDLRNAIDDLLSSRRLTAEKLVSADVMAQGRIAGLRSDYRLTPPEGVGLNADLRRDWDYLQDLLGRLNVDVWDPALQNVEAIILRASSEMQVEPARQDRFRASLARAADEARGRALQGAREASTALGDVEQTVRSATERGLEAVDSVADQVLELAEDSSMSRLSDERLVARRLELEDMLDETATREERVLVGLADRLRRASALTGTSGPFNSPELTAVLDEELVALRERVDRDFELAQLGLATEVISHELDHTIRGVREALTRLRAWSDVNPSLSSVHDDLRTGFDHLDSYLALFTPLQRRLRRRRVPIRGYEIEEFLRGLFERRLVDDDIALEASDTFRSWQHNGFRSTLYPVFVNLVDNATYWVGQSRPPRWIRLDADGASLLIRDSGRGVPDRDQDAIWHFGFTRKPGGRGAGLAISREVLARDDWSITLEGAPERGTQFRIEPPPEETSD